MRSQGGESGKLVLSGVISGHPLPCLGAQHLACWGSAPLGETATNHSYVSFHRALHYREQRGNFPSHSSAVFLFCNFSNYRERVNETGYLLLSTSLSPSGFAALAICSPADVTVTLCSATAGWRAAGIPAAWHP